jgi:hypothetical protein
VAEVQQKISTLDPTFDDGDAAFRNRGSAHAPVRGGGTLSQQVGGDACIYMYIYTYMYCVCLCVCVHSCMHIGKKVGR